MQLQGQKDNAKNNENFIVVILNIDTDFTFFFLNFKSTGKLSS